MVPRMVCGRKNFQKASKKEVVVAGTLGLAMGCVPPACGWGERGTGLVCCLVCRYIGVPVVQYNRGYRTYT